jgi:N-acetylglucosamine kinase-like BadF-type ATPase
LGLEGLRAVVRASDGRGPVTALTSLLLRELELPDARDLIPWLYRAETPRTTVIAQVAEHVLSAAEQSDTVARQLVDRAADELEQRRGQYARVNMRCRAIRVRGRPC